MTLHIPDIPATRNFIDATRLVLLKPGAWLINTARGGVLDEDALFEAASTARLGGAVLDVFKQEPYVPATRDLRTLENVLLTPHIGSSTIEACRRMALAALANIRAAARGEFDRMTIVN